MASMTFDLFIEDTASGFGQVTDIGEVWCFIDILFPTVIIPDVIFNVFTCT